MTTAVTTFGSKLKSTHCITLISSLAADLEEILWRMKIFPYFKRFISLMLWAVHLNLIVTINQFIKKSRKKDIWRKEKVKVAIFRPVWFPVFVTQLSTGNQLRIRPWCNILPASSKPCFPNVALGAKNHKHPAISHTTKRHVSAETEFYERRCIGG